MRGKQAMRSRHSTGSAKSCRVRLSPTLSLYLSFSHALSYSATCFFFGFIVGFIVGFSVSCCSLTVALVIS